MQLSVLYDLVEDIPDDGLGVEGDWSWEPVNKSSVHQLGSASPTTEYSSNESSE